MSVPVYTLLVVAFAVVRLFVWFCLQVRSEVSIPTPAEGTFAYAAISLHLPSRQLHSAFRSSHRQNKELSFKAVDDAETSRMSG